MKMLKGKLLSKPTPVHATDNSSRWRWFNEFPYFEKFFYQNFSHSSTISRFLSLSIKMILFPIGMEFICSYFNIEYTLIEDKA